MVIHGQLLLRQALTALIESASHLEVVDGSGSGIEGVELVERLRPDLVILDLALPGLNGVDAIRKIRRVAPRVSILVLAGARDEQLVLQALRAGALGSVQKNADFSTLREAIRAVVLGARFVHPPITDYAIEAFFRRSDEHPPDPYDMLTFREREVLQLVAEGHTNAEVGGRLCISHRTVEAHRQRAMHKLNLRSIADLIRYATRRGHLQLDE